MSKVAPTEHPGMDRLAPGISPEHAVAAPRHPLWAHPGSLSLLCLALIVYGSLLPFDLRAPTTVAQWRALPLAPRWVGAQGAASSLGISASASDLAINLLLYVPLGVLLRFSIPGKRRLGLFGVGLAILGVLATSWMLESLQSLSPSRVSSLNDVVANGVAGGLAATLCVWGWDRVRAWVFRLYCRTAGLRFAVLRGLEAMRSRVWLTLVFTGVNAVLIGLWYLLQVSEYMGRHGGAGLPFADVFELPYDVAAVTLGRSMLIYVGLSTLVLLTLAGRHARVRLGWVVVVVTGLSVAAEAHRVATQNARPNITGLILAGAAATLMALTLYCLKRAVQRSNRRRQQAAYDGPDRRTRAYPYNHP